MAILYICNVWLFSGLNDGSPPDRQVRSPADRRSTGNPQGRAHLKFRRKGRLCIFGSLLETRGRKSDAPEKRICRRGQQERTLSLVNKKGYLSRINGARDCLERGCSLFRLFVLLLPSVLLGCLTEGAAEKPTEMTLIRKSAFGRHVGD